MIFEIPENKYQEANTYQKRDCYSELDDYINNDSTKVCTIYGLRRTGKKTMMFQAMKEVGLENIGYILCENNDEYSQLCMKLNEFINQKKKVVFIDEITKISDFMTSSASLADYYSGKGTKIVITGTDSLGLNIVACGELFDRTEKIHTTYISFGEFSRLLGKTDIDEYIQYAGVLSHESKDEDRIFFNRENASRYIDSAISSNITNTFFKDKLPSSFIHKYDKLIGLHNRNVLIPIITAIVEMYSGVITKDSIDEYFKQKSYSSKYISSAMQMLSKHNIFIEKNRFNEDIEGQIVYALNSRRDINDTIDEDSISQIIDYLYDLELIMSIPLIYHNDNENAKRRGKEYVYKTDEYIYQAGMKYCQAKAVIDIIKTIDLSPKEKELLCQKIEEDVKGQILENSVDNDILHFINKEKYNIFKMIFKGEKDGEIDLVIQDKEEKLYYCFEIKNSSEICERQQEHISYKPYQDILDSNFGEKKYAVVLYRGRTIEVNSLDIIYINVEEFLLQLYYSNECNMDIIIEKCIENARSIDINLPLDKYPVDLKIEQKINEYVNKAKVALEGVSDSIFTRKEKIDKSSEQLSKQNIQYDDLGL